MSTTLYIETNFLVAVAFGREGGAPALFSLPSSQVHVALPDVCVMEAMSVVEQEQKRRRSFSNDTLIREIQASRRDLTSANSASIVASLDAARLANLSLANEIGIRLSSILTLLSGQPPAAQAAELLPLSLTALTNSSLSPDVEDQPTDTLILRMITEHALAHPNTPKALLSENSKDFDAEPVRSHLQSLNIKYFRLLSAFLGWNAAQPPVSP